MNTLEFLAALIWPVFAVVVLLYFGKEVRQLIASIKTLKIKAGSTEVELSRQEAEDTLNELFQDVASMLDGITEEDKNLFGRIRATDGRLTVEELYHKKFQRDTPEHQQLQRLRDRKLIRPFEGSSWQAQKHPVVTRFAQLVLRMMPQLLQPKPATGSDTAKK